jgi:DeoR/GlpR family transcriptional regulator of sugar metabolism
LAIPTRSAKDKAIIAYRREKVFDLLMKGATPEWELAHALGVNQSTIHRDIYRLSTGKRKDASFNR